MLVEEGSYKRNENLFYPFAYLIFDKSRNKSVVMKKDERFLKVSAGSLMVCVDGEDNLY